MPFAISPADVMAGACLVVLCESRLFLGGRGGVRVVQPLCVH